MTTKQWNATKAMAENTTPAGEARTSPMRPYRPRRQRSGFAALRPGNVLAATVALGIFAILSAGCGGGQVAAPIYTISPSDLSSSPVVATRQVTFSGYVANTSRTARFYVEKPASEATFDSASPVSRSNPLRGTIDHFTGVYTAPATVWSNASGDNQNPGSQSQDTVSVINSDQEDQMISIVKRMTDQLDSVPDIEITSAYPGINLSVLKADIQAKHVEDAYSRLVASLSSKQKASVTFNIYYQTVFNPAAVTASIRTTTPLAGYVSVLGDVRSVPDQNKHVSWSIVNPELGAGGKVDPNTGIYTAPDTTIAVAAGSRATYDIIQASSKAYNKTGTTSSTIQVNIISGVAGVGVTAQ